MPALTCLSLPLVVRSAVYGVTLEPADVEVADIAEAAREGRRPADFVVREVTARLGALLHRWAGRARRGGGGGGGEGLRRRQGLPIRQVSWLSSVQC